MDGEVYEKEKFFALVFWATSCMCMVHDDVYSIQYRNETLQTRRLRNTMQHMMVN